MAKTQAESPELCRGDEIPSVRPGCSALWLREYQGRPSQTTCGKPATRSVSFLGVSFFVCRYHSRLMQRELAGKMLAHPVTETKLPRRRRNASPLSAASNPANAGPRDGLESTV